MRKEILVIFIITLLILACKSEFFRNKELESLNQANINYATLIQEKKMLAKTTNISKKCNLNREIEEFNARRNILALSYVPRKAYKLPDEIELFKIECSQKEDS